MRRRRPLRAPAPACENPCKDMPFEPKTQNERDVIAVLWPANYTVAMTRRWGMYVAEEFEAANSNSDQTLTKLGRMEDLARARWRVRSHAGVEMRVLDFGTAAILISSISPNTPSRAHHAGFGSNARALDGAASYRRASRIRQPASRVALNPRSRMHPNLGKEGKYSLPNRR